MREERRVSQNVIPAKAGIQRLQSHAAVNPWIPAFAGMTIGGVRDMTIDEFCDVTIDGFRDMTDLRDMTMDGLAAPLSPRHSREGGNPETSESCRGESLDPRFRGDDDR